MSKEDGNHNWKDTAGIEAEGKYSTQNDEGQIPQKASTVHSAAQMMHGEDADAKNGEPAGVGAKENPDRILKDTACSESANAIQDTDMRQSEAGILTKHVDQTDFPEGEDNTPLSEEEIQEEKLSRAKDLERRLESIEQAALSGDTSAQFALACILEEAQQYVDAKEWLSKAAQGGLSDAQYTLARKELVAGDTAMAKHWFTQAAEQGHSMAAYALACMLELEEDYAGAKHWLNMAESHNLQIAQKSLEALERRKQLAEESKQGDEDAIFELAEEYYHIELLEPSLELFLQLAEKGHATAMYNAGLILRQLGIGEEAVEWFIKAAENGIPQAMLEIGDLHEQTGNDAPAKEWYNRAAENGVPDALYRLARMYRDYGNKEKAESYQKLALEAGSQEAQAYAKRQAEERKAMEKI